MLVDFEYSSDNITLNNLVGMTSSGPPEIRVGTIQVSHEAAMLAEQIIDIPLLIKVDNFGMYFCEQGGESNAHFIIPWSRIGMIRVY